VKKLATLIVAGGAVALLVAAFAPAAAVDTYTVGATLKNNTEVPRPKGATFARGAFSGKYVEHGKTATLTWKLTFSRLTGAAVAAHIHAGKRGVAGPVIVPLCGPCENGQVGKATITAATISKIESGNAYVNVHTAKNAGGEIRGQIAAKA
jgi:CHRD domain